MKRQRRTSKWIIAAALVIVEEWAAGTKAIDISPLISAVKEYDEEYFFQAYKRGYEKALKARVAAGKS